MLSVACCTCRGQLGHHVELAREWRWPQLGSAEAVVAVETRTRSARTRAIWEWMEAILVGTLDAERPAVGLARVHCVRNLVSRLPPAWVVTRFFLNLWTTPHRMHDVVCDGCYWGCDAPDSLDHYVECFPPRMAAGMFDDAAAPHDDVASFFGFGPARQCPNIEWAIRRVTLACAACQVVRAHRRDHGVPIAGDADRIARRAAVHAFVAVGHWHEGDGRDAVAPGQQLEPPRKGAII